MSLIQIEKDNNHTKTYGTRGRAICVGREVAKNYCGKDARYIISTTEDGRFHPIFIGVDCNAVIFRGFMWVR